MENNSSAMERLQEWLKGDEMRSVAISTSPAFGFWVDLGVYGGKSVFGHAPTLDDAVNMALDRAWLHCPSK